MKTTTTEVRPASITIFKGPSWVDWLAYVGLAKILTVVILTVYKRREVSRFVSVVFDPVRSGYLFALASLPFFVLGRAFPAFTLAVAAFLLIFVETLLVAGRER